MAKYCWAFFGLVFGLLGDSANASNDGVSGYLLDSRGQLVLTGTGLCIRTGYWTPALARVECDPDLIAKPIAAPTPAAAAPAPPAPLAGADAPPLEKIIGVEIEREISSEAAHLELMPSLSKVGVVKVYFGTDRMPTGRREATKFYADSEDEKLNLGIAYVSIPPRKVHTSGGFEEPKWWKLEFRQNPAKHIVLQHVSPYADRQSFLSRLRQDVTNTKGKELFVFIHGFNVDFDEAARRTAQISFDLDLDITPVLFSWASAGKVLEYIGDGDMSDQSVDKLQEFLQLLIRHSGAEAIHLIAHSMGNRFMTRAVNQLSKASPDEKRPFNQIIMAAPDVKKKAFEQVLGPALRKSSCHTTLYLSSKDKAIWLSSAIIHRNERIGSVAPAFSETDWIDAIDASNVNHDLLGLNHSYYAMAAMLDDIRMVLRRFTAPRFTLDGAEKAAPNHWQLGRKKAKRQAAGYFSNAKRIVCPR